MTPQAVTLQTMSACAWTSFRGGAGRQAAQPSRFSDHAGRATIAWL